MPQSLPASPRLYPSSTKASANIRLVASASLLRVATSGENHTSANLQRSAESEVNAAGITAPAGGRSSWEPAGQTKAIADVERHQREIDGAIGKLDCLDGVEESPKFPA